MTATSYDPGQTLIFHCNNTVTWVRIWLPAPSYVYASSF